MVAPGELLLRDVHVPAAPSWWPPAPGWWLLAGVLLLVLGGAAWLLRRRRQRQQAWRRLFDETLGRAQTPAAQVAAISELLRRAARRRDPLAASLQGEDWLRFLDEGEKMPAFAGETGRLLLEGGFRREVPATQVDALRTAARARFLVLMAAKR